MLKSSQEEMLKSRPEEKMEIRKEELSKQLSNSLDSFGYSKGQVKRRIETINKMSEANKLFTQKLLKSQDIEKIIVGSKREGVSLQGESDTDILQIDNSKLCYLESKTCDSSRPIFHAERKGAPNGYCYLKLVGTYQKDIKFAIIRKKNKFYLSSTKYVERNEDVFKNNKGCIGLNTVYKGTKGPALQKSCNVFNYSFSERTLESFNNEIDIVKAFPCFCPSIIKTWCNRRRKHDWPSVSMIKHVESLQVHVVPVGKKGDPKCELQWRISFTMAEVYLIQQMNDTQTKVYVLLRWIAKYFLTPVCKDITSYIVKNIILWRAEKHDTKHFRNENLLDCLEDALRFLKKCIKKKILKNYMIPSRNLFNGRLTSDNALFVTQSLDYMLKNGEKVVNIFFKTDGRLSRKLTFERDFLDKRQYFDKRTIFLVSNLNVDQVAFVHEASFYCTAKYTLVLFNISYQLLHFTRTFGSSIVGIVNSVYTSDNSLQIKENDSNVNVKITKFGDINYLDLNERIYFEYYMVYDLRTSKDTDISEAISANVSLDEEIKITSRGCQLDYKQI